MFDLGAAHNIVGAESKVRILQVGETPYAEIGLTLDTYASPFDRGRAGFSMFVSDREGMTQLADALEGIASALRVHLEDTNEAS